MAKGEIIVEGAKSFCSNSVEKNSKATAVSIAVKSQTKNLGKNKYFAQEKTIATNLDNKAESFNNGEGFGECYTTDKKKLPCKAKCSIKYKDYYENVDFDKSMKVLLDISTGTCPGYGLPGIIEFATTGQKKAVNTIDVKEADDFTVENTSAQWETYNPAKEDSVSEINIIAPFAEKPTGKYYFIERAVNSGFFPLSKLIIETKLHLKAISKGDPSKITWAIFKGEGVTDKVKTFVGIGANIEFTLDKLFKDFDEGVYRIEAYARKAGSEKCFILIEYIKDYVEGITAPGKKLVKNTPIPLTLKFKASSFAEKLKILNPPTTSTETLPNAHWRVTQENRAPLQNIVIYNSQMNPDSNLVKVEIQIGLLGVFIFRNPGIYEIEAYTTPDDPSPVKTTLTVVESLEINTVKGTSSQLLRYNESLKVEVSKFNVDFLPTNTTKMQWHLQKDGVRLTVFENAAISKEKSISKPINEILYYDARGGNNYFGKYVIEAYAKLNNKPLFNGADSFFFEVIRNAADKVTLSESIPKGAKVKYEVAARIMPLTGDEKINLELPTGVTDNHDLTLTFDTEGTFEIAAYLTGDETLQTKVKAKIKVANPELKRALWAYGTGYRRTETGYNEETHAFVEIAGLENQTITIKIWVKGAGGSFYLEPAKYMLEEKKITLNDRGIGSFKITTDDKYKEKIKKVLPATSETPNPNINLTFTIEPPTGNQGAIILPATMAIKNGKSVAGTKFIEVLDPNEELALTSNKVVKSIFFAKEDSKGVQQTITHQNKTHKIWVHTANMQEEEVRVDVMTLVHSDCMEEKNGIITALQSIQEYKEKVGSDGLLELPFTAEEKYLTDAETNPVRFSIHVSRKVKDPNDDKKEIYVFEDDQLAPMSYPNASIVRSPDMKTIGIKAKKQDDTPFTKEEKIALRKQLICFKNTALIVQKGILTQEAIENCTVPVVVDLEMAEVQTSKVCSCKENNFYWSSRITCDERKKVLEVCAELWGESKKVEKASELMSIFHLETFDTFSPSKENGKGFVGLIQFDESAANSLGTSYAKLKAMTFIDQLVFVKKYLQKNKDKLTTLTDFYLQVIKPNAVGHGNEPDYIVFDESISVPDNGIETNPDKRKKNIQREPWVTKYGYASNHIFMKENGEYQNIRQAWHYSSQANTERRGFVNGKTTIKEIKQVVMKDHYEPGKNNIFLGSCKNAHNLELSGRAPWMAIVLSEAKKYGGYYEGDDTILNKRIKAEYFAISNEGATSKSDPTKVSWCAVFASWCLQKAGYAHPGTCRALEFNPGYIHEGPGKEDKKLSHMRKITKPVYGCIIVWKNKSEGGGHVAFYYGKTADGNIIPIGGNQGNSLQFSNRNPKGDTKQEIIGYFLPEDYTENPADEFTELELKLDPVLLNKSDLLAKNGFVSTST